LIVLMIVFLFSHQQDLFGVSITDVQFR
jgi:hypothetical protein